LNEEIVSKRSFAVLSKEVANAEVDFSVFMIKNV